MNNGVNTNRIEWLDIARGIGLFCVILGHSVTTVIRENSSAAMWIYNTVYYFHMSLLFFISGTAFGLKIEKYKKVQILDYIKDKAKRLLIPYVLYSFILFIIFSIANIVPGISNKLVSSGYGKISFFEWLYQLLIGDNLYCQHLWYIYSLFILSVLAFLSVRFFGRYFGIITVVLAIFINLMWSDSNRIAIIWKTAYVIVWFFAGAAIGLRKEMENRNKIILIILVPLMILLRNRVPYYYGDTFYIPLRYVTLFVIIMAIIAVSQLLSRLGSRPLVWLGRESFPIYLFHQPFFGSGIGVVLYGILKLPIPIVIMISIVLSIFVPIGINSFIEKTNTKIGKMLIGKL